MTKPISRTRNVGIYIFDEVEVLDLGGPFEVFPLADFTHGSKHAEVVGSLKLSPDFMRAADALDVLRSFDQCQPGDSCVWPSPRHHPAPGCVAVAKCECAAQPARH